MHGAVLEAVVRRTAFRDLRDVSIHIAGHVTRPSKRGPVHDGYDIRTIDELLSHADQR